MSNMKIALLVLTGLMAFLTVIYLSLRAREDERAEFAQQCATAQFTSEQCAFLYSVRTGREADQRAFTDAAVSAAIH